jgi:pyruvate kinase
LSRRTKIVATIGPASQDEQVLENLMIAGLNVARMNFSHGTHAQHAERIATLRRVAQKLKMPVGILQDLQGPKIRVGKLEAPIQLSAGDLVCLYAAEDAAPPVSGPCIPVDFPELFESVHPDDPLLLDDGRLRLQVLTADQRSMTARVLVGGPLSSHKGINLPGVRLRVAGFTEKDRSDLTFGMSQGVDAVAVSFVRTVDDVNTVRAAMQELAAGRPLPLLIAKLERPEAMDSLDAILEAVDGVMVARGDLGVEMPPERVPVLQKKIIHAANKQAKLVITATQMLESMIHNPLPTRAEATDVANAVFDGTDAVMLSAETAAGEYPVDSVEMMDRILREAETHFVEWGQEQGPVALGDSDAASMARAAAELAYDRDVEAVSVFTMQGRTAWLMSKVRTQAPILAFTPEKTTCTRLTFLWGVRPYVVEFAETLEEMLSHIDAELMRGGMVQPGQQVVLVCGFPVGAMRPPNMALLHTVGGEPFKSPSKQ